MTTKRKNQVEPLPNNPNVRDIVKHALLASGCDGLWNEDGECACLLDDMMPCGEFAWTCRAGYRRDCDGCDFDPAPHWHIDREDTP